MLLRWSSRLGLAAGIALVLGCGAEPATPETSPDDATTGSGTSGSGGGAGDPLAGAPSTSGAAGSVANAGSAAQPSTQGGSGGDAPGIDPLDPPPGLPEAGTNAEPPVLTSELSWARAIDDATYAYDVAVDSNGRIVIAAFARDGLVVDGASFPRSLIIELDAEGERTRTTPVEKTWVQAIAIDGEGAIVMAGTQPGTSPVASDQPSGSNNDEVLVAKLDAGGQLAWRHALGDDGGAFGVEQSAAAIAVDDAGNVIFTGAFVGSFAIGDDTLTSAGYKDVFVSKLSPDGEPIWSRAYGAPDYQAGYGVATDAAGGVLLLGWYVQSIDLGGGALPGDDRYHTFLARLDADGEHVWSQPQELDAVLAGVVADGAFALVESERDASGAVLGTWLARFDAAGGRLETRELTSDENPFEVTSAAYVDGELALGGKTKLPGEESTALGIYPPTRLGVMRCDAALRPAWQLHFGDGINHTIYAVALDPEGGSVVVGQFGQEGMTVEGVPLSSARSPTVFVARFTPPH